MKKERFGYIVLTLAVLLCGIWFSSYRKSEELTFAKDSKIYYDNVERIESIDDALYKNTTVNINTATAEELESLDGIGEKTAAAIIEYRTENGGFSSTEELKNIKGIGDKIFENIEAFITAEGEE